MPRMANARWTVSSSARLNSPDATSKPSQAMFLTAHKKHRIFFLTFSTVPARLMNEMIPVNAAIM